MVGFFELQLLTSETCRFRYRVSCLSIGSVGAKYGALVAERPVQERSRAGVAMNPMSKVFLVNCRRRPPFVSKLLFAPKHILRL